MKRFNHYLKKKISEEYSSIPDAVKINIEETLKNLPESESKRKFNFNYKYLMVTVASFVFVTLFLLPNISITYAQALEQIPILGDLVHVVTIRNYYYSDNMHEMNIQVPEIDGDNNEAYQTINAEITTLTDTLLKRFYDDVEQIGDQGHSSMYVNYEVKTNTKTWFTLKIQVIEAAGSGNTYYRYYHLNKLTGQVISLQEIANDESFYQIVEEDIRKQMIAKMAEDPQLIYWVNNQTFGDCVSIDGKHNFYWDENGNLVIPFDKYEVAPGYMGTPEFTVSFSTIEAYIKDEFKTLFK